MGPSTRDESKAPRARFVHNFDSDHGISSSASSSSSSEEEEEEEEDNNDQTEGEEEEEEVSSDDVETAEVEEEEEEEAAAAPSSSSLASSQRKKFSSKKKQKQQAEVQVKEEAKPPQKTARTTNKSPITISLKKVCKVCKRKGHEAGFKGAVYIDCPMKPCFLCKRPGHTTVTCPHRVAMEHGVVPGFRRHSNTSFDYIFQRQLKAKVSTMKPPFVIPSHLECGNIRFHSRRVTCLEFHPTKDNILLSGDKKGQLGIWDYDKLHEKIVYEAIHSCIVNNMKFNLDKDGAMYTSSSDGTVHCTDLETGISSPLMDLNPDGWNKRAPIREHRGSKMDRKN